MKEIFSYPISVSKEHNNYQIITFHITMQGQGKSLLNKHLISKTDHHAERRAYKIFMTDSQGKINHITLH